MYQLIINFKTYSEVNSKKFTKLLHACEQMQEDALKKNVQLIIAPQYFDLKEKTSLQVFSQHIDPINPGSHTGHIVPKNLKELGVAGSLINHSENRVSSEHIKKSIELLRELKMKSCLCVKDSREVKKYKELQPNYIAVEPPELIGGDISISTAQPELIKKSLKAAGDVPLLIGAGVKTTEDVKIGIKMGAKGILVASGVVKSKFPQKAIKKLLDGF